MAISKVENKLGRGFVLHAKVCPRSDWRQFGRMNLANAKVN